VFFKKTQINLFYKSRTFGKWTQKQTGGDDRSKSIRQWSDVWKWRGGKLEQEMVNEEEKSSNTYQEV